MNRNENMKGITLVALIITIIVMLILVAVSVTIAIKGNLFNTTKRAAKGTKAEIEAEQELSNGRVKIDGTWYDTFEDYVGGRESEDQTDPEKPPLEPEEPETPSEEPEAKPEIGDYVNYEPDVVSTPYSLLGEYSGYGEYNTSSYPNTLKTSSNQSISQNKLTWQVLKIHSDGTIDLIGSPTSTEVYFQGALGYNNGVYLMHDICEKLYSRKDDGITARSVSLEDFEDESNGGNWESAIDGYATTDGIKYGDTKEYTDAIFRYYPNIYAQENGSGIDTNTVKTNGIKSTNKYYTIPTKEEVSQASSKLTVTQTYYKISSINEANYGNTADVLYNVITYWVAARCVYCSSLTSYFALRSADTGFKYDYLLYSDSTPYEKKNHLRPVVSLSSSVQLKLESEGTDGEPSTFEITKY